LLLLNTLLRVWQTLHSKRFVIKIYGGNN